MSKSDKPTPPPDEMAYEVTYFPSLAQRRARVAIEAESMNVGDLREAAAGAHIDVGQAKTKAELVEAVRQGARGTDATT